MEMKLLLLLALVAGLALSCATANAQDRYSESMKGGRFTQRIVHDDGLCKSVLVRSFHNGREVTRRSRKCS
jgi:hypothetical protein